MKRLFILSLCLLTFGCQQLKGGDPVITSTGKVPQPVTKKSVTISWPASSGTVQGYKLEGSLDGASFTELLVIDGAFNGIITNLDIGQKYYFRVRAFNQGGNSGYTPVTTITL